MGHFDGHPYLNNRDVYEKVNCFRVKLIAIAGVFYAEDVLRCGHGQICADEVKPLEIRRKINNIAVSRNITSKKEILALCGRCSAFR
jgi:hypothetical protein